MSVVRRYLDAVADQDWATAAGCLSENVRRTGPFCDVYEGRDAYVAFLRDLMPKLDGYRMEITRILDSGSIVLAELSETVGGVVTPECLVFDLEPDGRIGRLSIYIQQNA